MFKKWENAVLEKFDELEELDDEDILKAFRFVLLCFILNEKGFQIIFIWNYFRCFKIKNKKIEKKELQNWKWKLQEQSKIILLKKKKKNENSILKIINSIKYLWIKIKKKIWRIIWNFWTWIYGWSYWFESNFLFFYYLIF